MYDGGKYEEAVGKYNEALVDDPDSALLHFNLGDAQYKERKYTDAVNAFLQVPADGDARAARVAYNLGNTKYRLGEAAATSDPKAAIGLWTEALVAYRRAMGADPSDVDAKFNHEFVEKKIAELKKKLEEQQKQQEQKKQQQQGEKDQQGQQQDEQKQQEKQGDQEQQKEQQEQPQAGGEQEQEQKKEQEQKQADQQPQATPQPEKGQEQQQKEAAEAASGDEKKDGEMSRQEAAALLDAQRGQEVQPEEVTKRLQGGVVGEAAEDW